MTSPQVNHSDEKVSLDSPEEYIFELSLYLLTAARGCVGEPHIYGSFRLLEAISRLTDLYSKTDKLKLDEFLLKEKKEIDQKKYIMMASEEEFIALMDRLISEFTDELERRYALAGETTK
jgi:hypothetical protein